MKLLVQIALILLLTGCINKESDKLMITKEKLEELHKLEFEPKFHEDIGKLYPGAPNEQIRIESENRVNRLLGVLARELPNNDNSDYVFSQFRIVMKQFDDADSEEKDRMLLYLEEIMTILGISSSNGLFNEWRYGFNP